MSESYDAIMRDALVLAEDAMQFAEIPVACILTGDRGPIASSQTMVRREGSIAAHGELFAILAAGDKVWSSGSLVLYTTLEPCLMCLGACAQAGISRVVYGMRAKPDGAGVVAEGISGLVSGIPSVVGGVLEAESVDLMKKFLIRHPDSPAVPYVNEMLSIY